MRLSDLLNVEVVDLRGRALGKVRDVRLRQDGPMVEGATQATFRPIGLIVHRHAFGARLGFYRRASQGPWPLQKLFYAMEKKAGYIEWEAIRAIEQARIWVDAPDPLPRVEPLREP